MIGVLGGMGVGTLTDMGVQKEFINEVSNAIQPGKLAIFFIVRDANPTRPLPRSNHTRAKSTTRHCPLRRKRHYDTSPEGPGRIVV